MMFSLTNKNPHILVIGSAHLDAIGSYTAEEYGKIDKPGNICFSIGGTAYNIAVNLANTGKIQASLYTHLKPNSPITQIILSKLHEEGVGLNYVRQDPLITEDSGFIAHLTNGELESAISSSQIVKAKFDVELLNKGIKAATVVVAECNLSLEQLNYIAKACQELKKPLIIAGVSETKCIKAAKLETQFEYLVVNKVEAAALAEYTSENIQTPTIAKTVIITQGAEGWTTYTNDKTDHFPAPTFDSVNNTTGAGDAFTAALALTLAAAIKENKTDKLAKLKENADKMVCNVLRKQVASGKNVKALESAKRAIRVPETLK